MIRGKKVILRLFTEADLEEFVALDNDYAERTEYLPPWFRSLITRRKQFAESEGWWSENTSCMVIADLQGRMLGSIAYFRRSTIHVGYEIGYRLLRRADRGKGYGTEALRLLSAYVFGLWPVPRLELYTLTTNVASRRIAEKCGYQLEGTLRKSAFVGGKYVDMVVYSLMREECPALRDALESL